MLSGGSLVMDAHAADAGDNTAAEQSVTTGEGTGGTSSDAAAGETPQSDLTPQVQDAGSAQTQEVPASSETSVQTSEKTTNSKTETKKSSEEKTRAKESDTEEKTPKGMERVEEALTKADAASSGASDAIQKLRSEQGSFSNARSAYDAAHAKVRKLEKRLAKLKASVPEIEAEKQRAQAVVDAVSQEKKQGAPADITDVLAGRASFDEIDSKDYLLDKVAEDRMRAIAECDVRLAGLSGKAKKVKKKIAAAKAKELELQQKCSMAALDAEMAASDVLAHDQQAANALKSVKQKGLSEEAADKLATGKESVSAQKKAHESTCASCTETVAAWYDHLDKTGHVKRGVTFGTGAEFSLDKKAFVKKWGAAIDAFFADYSKIAGAKVALSGTGKTMAAAAFEHRVDPRLCAAVSIIESGGGQACIKSCNAWGWGAADSDPYGGASAWGSWPSAIEAWHKGVATSTMGLATAKTLYKFGTIYCSSADWAEKVAKQMQKISSLAK